MKTTKILLILQSLVMDPRNWMLHVRVRVGMEVVGACLEWRRGTEGCMDDSDQAWNERTKKLSDDGLSPMTEGMDGCSICYS